MVEATTTDQTVRLHVVGTDYWVDSGRLGAARSKWYEGEASGEQHIVVLCIN